MALRDRTREVEEFSNTCRLQDPPNSLRSWGSRVRIALGSPHFPLHSWWIVEVVCSRSKRARFALERSSADRARVTISFEHLLQLSLTESVLSDVDENAAKFSYPQNAPRTSSVGRSVTIYGGTNEVQRPIIAQHILRLRTSTTSALHEAPNRQAQSASPPTRAGSSRTPGA